MTDTVRETKRADELQPGDWVAIDKSDEVEVAEVKAAFQFPTKYGPRVHLTTQMPGEDPYSTSIPQGLPFELATETEVVALREQADRAKKIADIRALADWLEEHPEMPMPYAFHGQSHGLTGDDIPLVRRLAESINAELDVHLDDRTTFEVFFGSASYTCIAWHREGRPAVPAPLVSDETIAEAAAIEERDRLAGGPPWEVADHPDHQLPGGWAQGLIR